MYRAVIDKPTTGYSTGVSSTQAIDIHSHAGCRT